jgi:hypothetical protein
MPRVHCVRAEPCPDTAHPNRRAFALALCLALNACAADPVKPPEPEVRYVPTPYAVSKPCFDEKDRPPPPVYTFTSAEEIDAATPKQVAEALHADRIADELYMKAIEDLFVKCMQSQGKDQQ